MFAFTPEDSGIAWGRGFSDDESSKDAHQPPPPRRHHGIFLCSTTEVYVGQWIAWPTTATRSLNGSTANAAPLAPTRAGRRAPLKWGLQKKGGVGPAALQSVDASSGSEDSPKGKTEHHHEIDSTRHTSTMPCRDGWGVHIHGHEKYEGEWKDDVRHGLGSSIMSKEDRYLGQFVNDQRSGRGLGISTRGLVFKEAWQDGKLVRKRLFFQERNGLLRQVSPNTPACDSESRPGRYDGLCGESSASGSDDDDASDPGTLSPHAAEQTPLGQVQCESDVAPNSEIAGSSDDSDGKSSLRSFFDWSVADVRRLVPYLGVDTITVSQLRAHRVDGAVLGTLSSASAVPFLQSLFQAMDGEESPSRRLLVIAVELFLKLRHKLKVPAISAEALREDCLDLEIPEGAISFDDLIGEGGYGRVYKGRWMHVNVAAKTFRGCSALRPPSGKVAKDFYSEMQVLRSLRHPNITLLLGVCFKPAYIIVTEFAENGSLFDHLHHRKPAIIAAFQQSSVDWSFSQLILIAREICCGMMYLHSRGILHCDLKSSNILLGGSHEVKICDFGLAHFLGVDIGPQQEEVGVTIGCVGTQQWMAPEVLRGERYSKAADVYSFGMILWEMISRQIPFHGYSPAQVVGIVGYGRRRPKSPAGCPETLRAVLRMALRPRSHLRRLFFRDS